MTPAVSIVDAMRDPALFAQSFPLPAWHPWVSCAAALSGLTGGDLSPTDHALIHRCLGGRTRPTQAVREAWLVIGRRGGKSRFAALVAIYVACCRRYHAVLAPVNVGWSC